MRLSIQATTFAASIFFASAVSASPVLVFDTAFFTGLPTDTLPEFSEPLTFVPTAGGEQLPVDVLMSVGEIDTPLTPQGTLPSDPNIRVTPIALTVEYFVDGSLTPTAFMFNGVLDQAGYEGEPGDYVAEDIIGFTDTHFGAVDLVPFPGTELVAEAPTFDFFAPAYFQVRFEPDPFATPEPRMTALLLVGMLGGFILLRQGKCKSRPTSKTALTRDHHNRPHSRSRQSIGV